MTNKNSNNSALDDTTTVATNNAPLTVQRKSNDLVLAESLKHRSNNAPESDSVARTTNDGAMVTQ